MFGDSLLSLVPLDDYLFLIPFSLGSLIILVSAVAYLRRAWNKRQQGCDVVDRGNSGSNEKGGKGDKKGKTFPEKTWKRPKGISESKGPGTRVGYEKEEKTDDSSRIDNLYSEWKEIRDANKKSSINQILDLKHEDADQEDKFKIDTSNFENKNERCSSPYKGKEATKEKSVEAIRHKDAGKKEASESNFDDELRKIMREGEELADLSLKSFMKPIQLNIDKQARPPEEAKLQKEKQVALVKVMCQEFRDVSKLDENEIEKREEKKKEMEKVKSARSYFTSIDKKQSDLLSGAPVIKFRTEEDVRGSFSRGNDMRLSQFQPGKINKNLTTIFDDASSSEKVGLSRPPPKKLMTLDQVLRKSSTPIQEGKKEKEDELAQLRGSRKRWTVPELQRSVENFEIKSEIESLRETKTPIKKRWTPEVSENTRMKTVSLDKPGKLDVSKVFKEQKGIDSTPKQEDLEINELIKSRSLPLKQIYKPGEDVSAKLMEDSDMKDIEESKGT